MAVAPAAFALVVMINGWIDGGPAARGNAITHIPGFTTEAKCQAAGDAISKASVNPQITKTVCVASTETASAEGTHALAVLISGWDDGVGGAARGNAMDGLSGFSDKAQCQSAADKIRALSANKEVTHAVCVEL